MDDPRWRDDIQTLATAKGLLDGHATVFDQMVRESEADMNDFLEMTAAGHWTGARIQAFWVEHALRMRYIRMFIAAATSVDGVLVHG